MHALIDTIRRTVVRVAETAADLEPDILPGRAVVAFNSDPIPPPPTSGVIFLGWAYSLTDADTVLATARWGAPPAG